MSKQKHAAGPWRLHPTDDTVVVAADGNEVAAIDGDYNDPDLWPIMEANARLIAAAPELIEALQRSIESHWATWVAARADVEGVALSSALFEKEPDVIAARALLARVEGDTP